MKSCLMRAIVVSCLLVASNSPGEETKRTDRDAIAKAIPLIEIGAAGSAKDRVCFTCHNQAVPILTLVEAKRQGFAVDEENLKKQIDHTSEHLKRGKKNYDDGKGQGGTVMTAGYALWALEEAAYQPDEVTAAVSGYLIVHQEKNVFWNQNSNRPPSSGSPFATSYLALRGLATYSTEEQAKAKESRIEEVREWLIKEQPKDLEDSSFRVRALKIVGAPQEEIEKATTELLNQQREDGGWAQKADMTSDAYASGTALVALLSDSKLPIDHPAIVKGKAYLLDTQQEDGSWHVVTRAKGFQTYFETGFPHGKDQFISMAASSWATLALLQTLEKVIEPKRE